MKYLLSFLFTLTLIQYLAVNEDQARRSPASLLKKTCYGLIEGITNHHYNLKKEYELLFEKHINETNARSLKDKRIAKITKHIQSLFDEVKDENLSLKEAIDYLIEQELKLYPPKMRDRIIRIMSNATYISSKEEATDPIIRDYLRSNKSLKEGGFNASFYHEDRNTIGDGKVIVILPKEYRHSAIEKTLAAHEIFHAIQIEKLRDDFSHLSDKQINDFSNTFKAKYALEYGAMAFEWKFLQSLPVEVKEKLLKEFEIDYPQVNNNNLMIKRFLSSEIESGDEYVQFEHRMGRYSKVDLGNNYPFRFSPRTKLITVTLSSIITYLYLEHECKNDLRDMKDTSLRKYICRPLLLE